ncbi:putative Norsolorinic acid reductase [Ophiobolus disseminans]|uniref:Putative Norsolorinic acid reductase n=1 Tax=Ophiobolus disseminans TaxID=1469910 RepID=A0A6A7AD71_9PLEO|nr:putative Norsolorinic acid reductase [Ophiobolus disseminans]
MAPKFNRDSLLFRHRQLAPTASARVSPLCLGSMTFGTAHNERYGECSKESAFDILDHFYCEGGTFIDTANVYRDGESEMWLGEWMASRNNRDDIFLATKYANPCMFNPEERILSNYSGTGSKSMKLSIEASLKRLQTTYVDLFYVHFWDFSTTIPELMHSLNDLVTTGKVIYLGISDTPAWVVTLANEYARNHGLRPFSVYQGMWNAGMRDLERDIIPMCRQQGMALCPYGVLGQGRFQTEEAYKEREKTKEGRNFIPLSARDKQVSGVLEEVARSKGEGVTLLNVALAYVMQKVPYVFPIVGQRKVSHLKGSIEALSVALTEEEVKKVEEAYEFDHGFPHTFLSGTLFDDSPARQVEGPGDVWLTKSNGPFDWVDDNAKPIRPPQ